MSKQRNLKPLAIAVGVAFTTSMAALAPANADENSFGLTELASSYMVATHGEGTCGEGKCGEGKCGADKGTHSHADKDKEGQCGEGKCGEGKCGGTK